METAGTTAVDEKQIEKVCHKYILGLVFVLRYYLKEIPTYGWNYTEHYAPLLTDLSKYSKTFDYDVHFDYKKPLNIYESLFGILPKQSFYLLPQNIVDGVYNNNKILLDPSFINEFEIDLDGKTYDYEGVSLLPFLEYDKIKKYFLNVKLTDDQKDKLIRRTRIYSF